MSVTPIEHIALTEKSIFHELQEDVAQSLVDALPDKLSESVVTALKGDPIKDLDARVQKTGIGIIVEVTDIDASEEDDNQVKVTLLIHVEEKVIVNHGKQGTGIACLDVACLCWTALKAVQMEGVWSEYTFGGLALSAVGEGQAAWDLTMTTKTTVQLTEG